MNKGIHIEGVCIENVDEYNIKCELIKKLVKSQYKNSSIKFEQSNQIDLVYVIIDNSIKFSIMPNVVWSELKQEIDSVLKSIYGKRMCDQCRGDSKCLASCNGCYRKTCLECYIDKFRLGKGIVKCNSCNYSFGVEVSDEYIDLAIDDIRFNANLN